MAEPAAEVKVRVGSGRGPVARVALFAAWIAAAWPVLLYVLHRSDPELAVRFVDASARWATQSSLVLGALALLALLLFPPFSAWVRRFAERTRTAWTVDRAPLLRALGELQHFESAQRHYEVARLAWIRSDLGLVGPHAARAVQLDPSMPQAHHLLGQLLLRVGAAEQAQRAFLAAEQLDPGHAFGQALLFAARATDELGEHDAAIGLFEQHERQHGGSNRSHYWHGLALIAAGRSQEAARHFAAAAAAPPQRLTAEENWFRALARVRCWRHGAKP